MTQLKELVPYLVDDEIGIVKNVYELPRQADMPDMFYYKADVSNTAVFGLPNNLTVSGGTSIDRDRALSRAVGEAVERYCSAIYNPEELITGSYDNMDYPTVPPENFKHFTETQFQSSNFQLTPFKQDTILKWCMGRNLGSGQAVMLPACMVYCPYEVDHDIGESSIVEIMSTGLAANTNIYAASLNAILEVVERDNFMITWLGNLSPPIIRPSSLNKVHWNLFEKFQKVGYSITLLNASLDSGIPTIIAVMHSEFLNSIPFSIAAASHLDPAIAITKCIEELALIERFNKRVRLSAEDWQPGDNFENVIGLIDHIKFWLKDGASSLADFLLNSKISIDLQDIDNLSTNNQVTDLEVARDKLSKTGFEVIIADITTPDIESLGLKVVRAVIPGYVPLNKRYSCRPIGNRRLQSFIQNNDSINITPHPFA